MVRFDSRVAGPSIIEMAARKAGPEALLEGLSEAEVTALLHHWRLWARPNQMEPEDPYHVWAIGSGRGWGKTRTGAETVRDWVESERYQRIHLVAPTAADYRDVMVEGESGLLAIHPEETRPVWEPSKRRLVWPNGAIAICFSADKPDRLRGPQCEAAWADEPASWRYLREAWDNLELGCRLGPDPRIIATTTPRPRRVWREVLEAPGTILTQGHTDENRLNLAPSFIAHIKALYEGTRTGLQELAGMLLEEAEGALWSRDLIERHRRQPSQVGHLPISRLVVAMDPADGGEDGDEQGLAVVAKALDHHYYVLHSEGSRSTPKAWVQRACDLVRGYGADRLLAEKNHGGAWIEAVVREVWPEAPYKAVNAGVGKRTRAEPVSALYEQGKVHHVGVFPDLEDQMTNFTGAPNERSPDRLDALVWAITDLQQGAQPLNVEAHLRDKTGESNLLRLGF